MKVCSVDDCNNKIIAKGYCPKHYTRLTRYGDPLFPGLIGGGRPKKINFKVVNGCFVLTSHKLNDGGYSEIMIKGRTQKIHRHIYEQCFGEIPDGLVVRHKCDNRACINPEHLEIGTQWDNMQDMVNRDRQLKGSRKPMSKLDEDRVMEIKKKIRNGMKNVDLAKEYKVDDSVISDIRHNKLWKHVKLEEDIC